MTQILAYQGPGGVVVATDSRAQHFDAAGRCRAITVHKLFRLSPHVVLVTGGAGYGLSICRTFQQHVEDKGLFHINEICYQALPIFRSQWQRFMRDASRQTFPGDELNRVYMLIAGRSLEDDGQPYRLCLWGSERDGESLHEIPVGHIVAIPRRIGFESRLQRLDRNRTSLQQVRMMMLRFLNHLAQNTDSVGPPFHFLKITAAGIAHRTIAGKGEGG